MRRCAQRRSMVAEEDPMNVAIYQRVSTDEQSSSNQRPDLERLCAARGWIITHRYEETISGAAKVRPQLVHLLADAHAGHFNAVVVWALDRLGRGGIADVSGTLAR